MNDKLQERAEIEERFADSAHRHFGEYLSLALSSGSFAYAGATKGKSDVDVMAVLSNNINHVPKGTLLDMIRGFSREYVEIHKQYGYVPDEAFPGEYITEANAEDAIAGRGFHASDTDIYLPQASTEYYQADPESCFRAWRSMLAFSRRIAGDEERFDETKLRAWEPIVLYLLSKMEEGEVNAEAILDVLTGNDDKWESVGVTQKCLTFREDEKPYIEMALVRLRTKKVLTGGDHQYGVENNSVNSWAQSLSANLKSGQLRRSEFLLQREDEEALTAYTRTLLEPAPSTPNIPLETERYSASPMHNRYLGDCMQIVYTANQEECDHDGMTDQHIIVFVKTDCDPVRNPPSSGKLFGKEHFANKDALLRITSACLHGLLGDTECTCLQDIIDSLAKIRENGCGVFVYMPQDALGRGLRDKVRDHRLMYGISEQGAETVPLSEAESMDAMYPEGYDIRNFTTLRSVFDDLGLSDVGFVSLGKNEQKIRKIRSETGISIASTMHWK